MPQFWKGFTPKPGAGYRLIYRASIRLKNGTILYARDYGRRGFPIWIR